MPPGRVAAMCPAFDAVLMTAGPDEVRNRGPNHTYAHRKRMGLALKLRFSAVSESVRHHDSEVM